MGHRLARIAVATHNATVFTIHKIVNVHAVNIYEINRLRGPITSAKEEPGHKTASKHKSQSDEVH
jgi:hypothetical protein